MSRFNFFKEDLFRKDLGVYRRPAPMGFQVPADNASSSSVDSKEKAPNRSAKTKPRVDRAEEFAAFLANDAELNPSKMIPLTESKLARAKRLVKGEHVD